MISWNRTFRKGRMSKDKNYLVWLKGAKCALQATWDGERFVLHILGNVFYQSPEDLEAWAEVQKPEKWKTKIW